MIEHKLILHVAGCGTHKIYINSLVQDCSNSIANALELLQSCTKPSIYCVGVELDNHMMISSNRNIFCITGPLWGESLSLVVPDRWIPPTKARDA